MRIFAKKNIVCLKVFIAVFQVRQKFNIVQNNRRTVYIFIFSSLESLKSI